MMVASEQPEDWKTVIKNGVDILVKNDCASPKLADAIFQATNEFGAYYVLEKGICLAHAKPGPYAKKTAISFQLLKENIQFNNEDKWARFIFTLSAPDQISHMNIIEQFGKIFTNEKLKKALLKVETLAQIETILRKEGLWL